MGEAKPFAVDFDRAVEWLESKWTGARACPICGNKKWSIAKKAAAMSSYYPDRMVMGGGPIYPFVIVYCPQCAYSMLFNGIVMGLIPKEADQEK